MAEHLLRDHKNMRKHVEAVEEGFSEAKPWAWGGKQHTEEEHRKLVQEDYERDLKKGKK